MAPRGERLYLQTTYFGIIEDLYSGMRYDGTWKVGAFRGRPMLIKRCVFKKVGLTEDEAAAEAARLRGRIQRGDLP